LIVIRVNVVLKERIIQNLLSPEVKPAPDNWHDLLSIHEREQLFESEGLN
jgi:hypothetical protein